MTFASGFVSSFSRINNCPEGSHLSMYDDQETYMTGLVDWLTTRAGAS